MPTERKMTTKTYDFTKFAKDAAFNVGDRVKTFGDTPDARGAGPNYGTISKIYDSSTVIVKWDRGGPDTRVRNSDLKKA